VVDVRRGLLKGVHRHTTYPTTAVTIAAENVALKRAVNIEDGEGIVMLHIPASMGAAGSAVCPIPTESTTGARAANRIHTFNVERESDSYES
jgi:hypothetical protein